MNTTLFRKLLYLIFCAVALESCEVRKTCSECVEDTNFCHWCAADSYTGIRCKRTTEEFTKCDQIENPKNLVTIRKDQDFSSSQNITQIKPQEIELTLRLGVSQEFEVTFQAAEDYPADLYFLIDASYSMTSIFKSVTTASAKLTTAMHNITKNVFLGMGTFIDKNTAPFVRARDSNAETYSFRHRINITSDIEAFQKIVKNTPVGTNYDDPEGGFDALAQVMACKEEIGWREVSRKIVFFFTDQLFHSAGDGKWGGIVRPYDGKCHMQDGKYNAELEMDYPSIGILNKLSAEEEVTVVFIVDHNFRSEYEHLAKTNERWKYLTFHKVNEVATFDKHELAQLISSIYEEISHTIKIKLNMAAELQNDIHFDFTPDCYRKTRNPACSAKKFQKKSFKGNVTLKRHFRSDSAIVNLTIQGIKEIVALNLKVADCNCSKKPESIEQSKSLCSGWGVKKCGICECDRGRTGKKCECAANGNSIGVGNDTCKPPGSTGLPCNGFGTCICGTCTCVEGREGEYCECDNNSCPKHCSGRGQCRCGKCFCVAGWGGDACDCQLGPCREALGKVCNGRGICECGKCVCQPPALWDARHAQTDACEMTPCKSCHNEQCLKMKDCALCYQKTNRRIECSSVCDSKIKIDLKESLENSSKNDWMVCEEMQADMGCYMRFQYKYDMDDYGAFLVVESGTDCLKSYYWFGGGFLLTLLILGILTLVAWKMLTDLRDRREYNRFLKSLKEGSAVCDNPIYEPATTTFRNPVFRKPSCS